MENDGQKRGSQFQILDILLQMTGLSFALGILVPVSGPRLSDQVMTVAAVMAMTLAGSAISYAAWRFFLTTRFTVCLVNHAGYLLVTFFFIAAINSRLLQELPVFLAGPVALFGHIGLPPHLVSRFWDQLLITSILTACIVLLMSTHTFRRNWIGVVLTSLGTAMWYLAGLGGVLARGP